MANILGANTFSGALGAAYITFDDVEMGLTVGDITLESNRTLKELMRSQHGTAPYDFVETGAWVRIKAKIAEATLAKMEKYETGITLSGAGTAMKKTCDGYKSLRDAAKTLILTRNDSCGDKSVDPNYIITCPLAIPVQTSIVYTFGPENERNVDIEWHLFYDSTTCCWFYMGAASSLGL